VQSIPITSITRSQSPPSSSSHIAKADQFGHAGPLLHNAVGSAALVRLDWTLPDGCSSASSRHLRSPSQ
jgi:hypothetical protein